MPNPWLIKLSKETGKPESELESLWNRAKQKAGEQLNVPLNDFDTKEYKYTVGIVKKMLGLDESINVGSFINSDMTAEQYIETVVSANFEIGTVTKVKDSKPPLVVQLSKRKNNEDEDDIDVSAFDALADEKLKEK